LVINKLDINFLTLSPCYWVYIGRNIWKEIGKLGNKLTENVNIYNRKCKCEFAKYETTSFTYVVRTWRTSYQLVLRFTYVNMYQYVCMRMFLLPAKHSFFPVCLLHNWWSRKDITTASGIPVIDGSKNSTMLYRKELEIKRIVPHP